MSIGIIGKGIVGSALEFAFQKLGEITKVHDIKLNTKIEDLLDTEAVFICVPTPKDIDNSCNVRIVQDVISELLYKNKYNGFIVIKSTVIPGTTQKLIDFYKNWNICYSLETLRERCATTDMIENQKLLAIGTENIGMFNRLVELHGHYPQKVVRLTATEAELLKYFHNTINSLRVSFAGEFYDIAEKLGCNYTKIKNALLHSTSLPDIYLDVNKNMRSWSSICWNKDIPAICKLGKDLGLDLPILYNIEVSNNRHEKTAFAGTRENYND